jgi:hypothetical protein
MVSKVRTLNLVKNILLRLDLYDLSHAHMAQQERRPMREQVRARGAHSRGAVASLAPA